MSSSYFWWCYQFRTFTAKKMLYSGRAQVYHSYTIRNFIRWRLTSKFILLCLVSNIRCMVMSIKGMSLVFLITIPIIYTFLTPICDAKTKEYHRYKYLHGKFLISYVYTLRPDHWIMRDWPQNNGPWEQRKRQIRKNRLFFKLIVLIHLLGWWIV